MPEIMSPRQSEAVLLPAAGPSDTAEKPRPGGVAEDPVTARGQDARGGLTSLLAEAEEARKQRDESTSQDGGTAVCAWNHFENIPTFYNWNNRPR
jgi:hypothetical protein